MSKEYGCQNNGLSGIYTDGSKKADLWMVFMLLL